MSVETLLEALGVAPGALWTPEGLPVVVPTATRDEHLLRAFGAATVLGRGAEVGVERAHFTRRICDALPDVTVYAVDAWQPYAGYRDHVSREKLDGFFAEAQARVAGTRAQLVRGFSVDVAATIPDGFLDWVYLDANHTLPAVIADLAAWVPKVRSGGLIAGHDFGRRQVGHVRQAVEAWTEAYGIAPWFVLAGDRSPSFCWVHP